MLKNIRNFLLLVSLFTVINTAFSSDVSAAPSLTAVRSSSSVERDRVVFDFSELPNYTISVSEDGLRIYLSFNDIDTAKFQEAALKSKRIAAINYERSAQSFSITLQLNKNADYKAYTLAAPARLVIDFTDKPAANAKSADGTSINDKRITASKSQTISGSTVKTGTAKTTQSNDAKKLEPKLVETEIQAGLTKRSYTYYIDGKPVMAYMIEADPKRYTIRPVLAKGVIPGREKLLSIANNTNALAAINASYFAPSGELIGVTKMNGLVVGTTYFDRSAIGMLPDGSFVFGVCSYDGKVQLDRTTIPISGVNVERGENNLIIYNKAFGKTTQTNEYGLEYIVSGGKIVDIRTNNSPIPASGYVVSVHGTAMDAFAVQGIRVGDAAVLTENIGTPWDRAEFIVGAGPRLVANGQVNVTAAAEKFPNDISRGRAPRSAVGVTKTGKIIFAVVDGRQSHSQGVTIGELAALLLKFGVKDAINLDGGGSSELVLKGQILNVPSDGSERAIGSALIMQER